MPSGWLTRTNLRLVQPPNRVVPLRLFKRVDTLDAREAPMVYRTNQYPLEDALPSVELNTGPRGAGHTLSAAGQPDSRGRAYGDAPRRRGVIADLGGWCRVWSQAAMNSWGELLSRPQQQAHIRLTQEWRSVNAAAGCVRKNRT